MRIFFVKGSGVVRGALGRRRDSHVGGDPEVLGRQSPNRERDGTATGVVERDADIHRVSVGESDPRKLLGRSGAKALDQAIEVGRTACDLRSADPAEGPQRDDRRVRDVVGFRTSQTIDTDGVHVHLMQENGFPPLNPGIGPRG